MEEEGERPVCDVVLDGVMGDTEEDVVVVFQ